ncbi:hypothetical protein DRQ33_01840 [bacterium]|nr:MAG: hypothetical protein DRQ33_01840 [bacterium]
MRRLMISVCLLVVIIYGQDIGYTYVNIGGLLLDIPQNGILFGEVKPDGPTDEVVDSYTGNFRINIIEENPDSSAQFYDIMRDSLLGNSVEVAVTGTAAVGFAITNSEAEFIMIYAEDIADELKPSIPVGVYVTPSGDSAVKIWHSGLTRMPVGSDGMILPIKIFPADTSNLPVPTYYDTALVWTAVEVRIIAESIDNGSAEISSLFGEEPGDTVILPAIGGISYMFALNSEAETITIEAVDIIDGTLTPDTFTIEFISEGGCVLLAGPFDGLAHTVGAPATCFSIMMTPDGEPDIEDDTTIISAQLKDITGTVSAEISPAERTLTNGVSAFTVNNDEPDSLGIFVHPSVVSGSPVENPMWTPIIFFPETHPTKFFYLGPNAIAMGDTALISFRLVNDFGEFATECVHYQYFLIPDIDEGTSIQIIDPATDMVYSDGEWEPLPYDTTYPLKLTASSVEEVEMAFTDAEIRGMFDMGMLKPTQRIEFSVLPVSGSDAGQYALYPPNSFWIFQTGMYFQVDVFAVDDAGAVDTTYSGTVATSITGSAFATSSVEIENGHGAIYVYDDYEEDVTLDIVGELVSPPSATLHFISPTGSGGAPMIVPDDVENILAGEGRELIVYVATISGVSSSFSGEVDVIVDEPDDDGSVVCPTTLEIENGIGLLSFYNSEPETVYITFSHESLIEMGNMVITSAKLIIECPETLELDSSYTLEISAVDYMGEPCPAINLSFYFNWEEEIDNNSMIYGGPYTPYFYEGVCTLIAVSNDEAEWVDIYIYPLEDGLLVIPDGEFDESLGWHTKRIYFEDVGINDTKPQVLDIGRVSPNPFNSSAQIVINSAENIMTEIEIMDISGRVLSKFSRNLCSGKNIINIRLDNCDSGIYFINIDCGNANILRKALLIK